MTLRRSPRFWRTALPATLAGAVLLGTAAVRSEARQAATTTPPAQTAASAPAGPLQAQAEAIVPNESEWTAMAWSVDRKETLFSINGDSIMIPASNNKVFSAIWAMAMLGPDYRFPTDLLVTGPIEGGVVRGDVVIRGSGDPALGYPEYDKDVLQSMRAMAASLKQKGVTAVEGGVIADASVFDSLYWGPDWPRDTGNGVSRYAPPVSGLAFQRNMLAVSVNPDRTVTTTPVVPEIPLRKDLNGGRGYATRYPERDTIIVRGGYPSRSPAVFQVGANQPPLLGGAALRQALQEAGIQVRGPLRIGKTPEGAELVHRHLSIPLKQINYQLGRNSDNFFAEHLFKAAAAKALGQGSYPRAGPASALFFHERAGVPLGQIWQADGSGLSSQNHASANAMVKALTYAHEQPWSRDFHNSLAVGGSPDGTLNRMFTSPPAKMNLHAKTGYINDVRTLSGYVTTRDGELVAFSLMYNGRGTSGARGTQIQLGELLAGYSRGGGAAAPATAPAADTAATD